MLIVVTASFITWETVVHAQSQPVITWEVSRCGEQKSRTSEHKKLGHQSIHGNREETDQCRRKGADMYIAIASSYIIWYSALHARI